MTDLTPQDPTAGEGEERRRAHPARVWWFVGDGDEVVFAARRRSEAASEARRLDRQAKKDRTGLTHRVYSVPESWLEDYPAERAAVEALGPGTTYACYSPEGIWGIGPSPEAAVRDHLQAVGLTRAEAEERGVVLQTAPMTDRLAAYVRRHGWRSDRDAFTVRADGTLDLEEGRG